MTLACCCERSLGSAPRSRRWLACAAGFGGAKEQLFQVVRRLICHLKDFLRLFGSYFFLVSENHPLPPAKWGFQQAASRGERSTSPAIPPMENFSSGVSIKGDRSRSKRLAICSDFRGLPSKTDRSVIGPPVLSLRIGPRARKFRLRTAAPVSTSSSGAPASGEASVINCQA